MPDLDDKIRAYVEAGLERFGAYHAHKETMAYAGMAAYGAAAVSVLTSAWPPTSWTWHPKVLAVVGFSAFWFAVLCYLRFQLRRRRWAALRVAGCDWLLASSLPGAPGQVSSAGEREPLSCVQKVYDWFWPLSRSVAAVDVDEHVYPPEILHAWIAAEIRGTEAIQHERLIHVVSWVLWLAVIVRTIVASPGRGTP